MKSSARGHLAENWAVDYLAKLGYKIIGRNWRTKYCEIDIIAWQNDRLYFVEVKFRASTGQGSGMEYITRKKLARMRYAANSWVQQNAYEGVYGLAALAISQNHIEFIEDVETV